MEREEDWSDLNIDWSEIGEPEDLNVVDAVEDVNVVDAVDVVDGVYTEKIATLVEAERTTKLDPRISYVPLVWEEFFQCPYNQAHLVNGQKFQSHINKCQIQYELKYKPGNRPGNIQSCKFNRGHRFPASDMENHEKLCPDQPHTFDYVTNTPFPEFLRSMRGEFLGSTAQDNTTRSAPAPALKNLTLGQTRTEPPRPPVPSRSGCVAEEDWDLEAAMNPPQPNWSYNPVRTMLENPHLLMSMPPGLPKNVRRALRAARAENGRILNQTAAEQRAQGAVGVHAPGHFEIVQAPEVDPGFVPDSDPAEAPDVYYNYGNDQTNDKKN